MSATPAFESRLAKLLKAAVEEYITTAEPVGSHRLVERYRLEVSPATIRNWFAELEQLGYLMQPHTSGGRVPTEQGFRTYVNLFVQPKAVGKRDRELLAQAMQRTRSSNLDQEQVYKQLAKTLADLSGLASVLGLGEADSFYTGLSQLFAEPEFRQWQRVVSLSQLLDHLDETLQALRRQGFDQPRVLIGQECPFGPACGAVLIAVPGRIFGILGPLRMDYQHSLSLLQTAFDLLSADQRLIAAP